MEEMPRRTVVRGAAWALPVIAAAVAVPVTAASSPEPPRIPVSCTLLNGTGSPYYHVTYSDGTSEQLHRRDVARDRGLRDLCKPPANGGI